MSGSWMLDTLRLDRFNEVFLKGKQVSHALVDKEKNIWFTTLGEGVYKLVSKEFKSWQFKTGQATEIFSLEKYKGKLVAGIGLGWIYSLGERDIDSTNFNHLLSSLYHEFATQPGYLHQKVAQRRSAAWTGWDSC
jgi:hypothetical protein